ncbi:ABC transporter substrate-binding protein [uncultured Clostridium sp.]|jgi:peptide/nickel transport system substrate-binding protein|uniref:ABC transporter substrate-binding protein n=1 Tax=uncultured Clostridium sp. TaxID=59620 RepID=UPI00260E1B9A|nr:ABC transporter substrate-binding protein [uncultured Clostridium sp.]
MDRQKNIKVILAIFLISVTMLGCSKITPVAKMGTKKEELIIATTSIPQSLHASSYFRSRDEDIICALFEGLVELTQSGEIGPALAQGWKVSEDGLKYSFLLEDEIYWSDGSEITVDDFLNYFEYLFSPDNIEYTSDELYHIYGVQEFKEGTKGFDDVGIHAISEDEFTIQLVTKDDNFLKKLTKPEFRLRDNDDNLENYEENFNDIRYTGAYKIESVESSTEIKFIQNSEYTLKSIGAKNITIVNSGDNIKDFAMYNTNKIDIVTNAPVTAFSQGNLINEISYTDSERLQYMVFNSLEGKGKYLDFRKAIYIDLSTALMESYLIENKFATMNFRKISTEEIEESIFYKKDDNQVYSKEVRFKNFQTAQSLLQGLPDVESDKIIIIGKNNYENQKLIEFLEKEFKELDIEAQFTLYDDIDEMNEKLKAGEFNIFIDSVNLEDENINNKINIISEYYEYQDYSVIAMYTENNYWCKSEKVKDIYIDDNGNMIFKKMVYIN